MGTHVQGAHSIKELIGLLKKPRRVMLMLKAGEAVDDLLDRLIPLLEPGDIFIDSGNSHFADSVGRTTNVESKEMLFIGVGISGAGEGACLSQHWSERYQHAGTCPNSNIITGRGRYSPDRCFQFEWA